MHTFDLWRLVYLDLCPTRIRLAPDTFVVNVKTHDELWSYTTEKLSYAHM